MPILINSGNRPQATQPVTQAQQGAMESARKLGDSPPVRDSAAMLAINNRISTQIRGINQAMSQSNDAVSMIQVAEHAMGEIEPRLSALGSVTRSAVSDQADPARRQALQKEAEQLHGEISALVEETEFDGVQLLDGGHSVQTKTGVGENDTRTIVFPDLARLAPSPDLSSGESARQQSVALDRGMETLAQARASLSGHHEVLAKGLKELTATAKALTSAESRATDTTLAENIATRVSSFLRQPSDATLQNTLSQGVQPSLQLLQSG